MTEKLVDVSSTEHAVMTGAVSLDTSQYWSRLGVYCVLGIVFAFARVAVASDAAPFSFEAPEILSGADVATTLMGATYAYSALDSTAKTRLMITTMQAEDIERQLGPLGDLQCANMFLDELRTSYKKFFVITMQRPLQVGESQFVQFRWTGESIGDSLTGVLSCGRLNEQFYVVHFVDQLMDATNTFPAIRAKLKLLRPKEK